MHIDVNPEKKKRLTTPADLDLAVKNYMWASILISDGGSKRLAWLGGPRPVLMKELDGDMKNQRKTFKDLPGPLKLGDADRLGVTEGSAQEGTDCVVDAFYNESLQCTSYSPKRSLSSSSADFDLQIQHNFSTILVDWLEEEARSQATLKKMRKFK